MKTPYMLVCVPGSSVYFTHLLYTYMVELPYFQMCSYAYDHDTAMMLSAFTVLEIDPKSTVYLIKWFVDTMLYICRDTEI